MSSRLRVGVLAFDAYSRAELERELVRRIECGDGAFVVTPNLQFQYLARRSFELRTLLEEAPVSVCDSKFLQTVSTLGERTRVEVITGSSLTNWIFELCGQRNLRLAVLGGTDKSHLMAGEKYRKSFPNSEKPVFSSQRISDFPEPAEISECANFVQKHDPSILIICLGFPKQERVARELHRLFPALLILCFGAGIDFYSGQSKRSPQLLQKLGLEWLWRLATEPKRLARRYLVEGIPEAISLIVGAGFSRLRGPK